MTDTQTLELERWQERAQLAELALDEVRERLRTALRELCSWQPHTDHGLEALHPQHREAILRARQALDA